MKLVEKILYALLATLIAAIVFNKYIFNLLGGDLKAYFISYIIFFAIVLIIILI
jgi:hypothetical protein